MKTAKKVKRKNRPGRKITEIISFMFILATALLTLSACGGGQQDADAAVSSESDSDVIILHGVSEEDISITVGELKELESVTQKAQANRSNGEKVSVRATGPLLETVLAKYGADKSDYNTIRFNAADGYSIAMTADIIAENDIILSYLDEGKLLSSENGPIRVVVPGQRAMYWVRMLESIDFETDTGSSVAEKVVFLDTALSVLEQESVDINGTTEKCVSTDSLIDKYANIDDNTVQNVYMTAADGLSKNETKDNFLGNYLRVSGDDVPEFTGSDLKEGMTVKGLLSICYGDTAFISAAQGLNCMGITDMSGTDGLAFSSVIKKIGSMATDTYVFDDLSGNTWTFTAEELTNAVVFVQNGKAALAVSGSLEQSFGSEAGVVISDLVSISAKEADD